MKRAILIPLVVFAYFVTGIVMGAHHADKTELRCGPKEPTNFGIVVVMWPLIYSAALIIDHVTGPLKAPLTCKTKAQP